MLNLRSINRTSLCYFVLLLFVFSCKSTPPINPVPNITEGETHDSSVAQRQVENPEHIRKHELAIKTYRASRARTFDLLHTNLELAFDYKNRTVKGKAILTLTPYAYPQKELVLDAKDFEVHKVGRLHNGIEQPLSFDYDQEKLTLALPEQLEKEDTLHVAITYTAFPEKGDKEGSAAITDTKGMYFINPTGEDKNKPVQIWTQGETVFNSKWFPTIDSPNERQTHDFYLTVPAQYLSLSNGELLGSKENGDGTRTDHWQMGIPHAPYLSAIVIGEFSLIEENVNGLKMRYFVEPKYKAGARGVFGNTPEMISFFSDLLDMPFPWQKYDQVVVRDFVSGAMENTTLSIFMDALNLNEREALDSEWDYIIAHELFHQWFGNFVTTESWANLTLNEAFADYSEYLWFEYKEGRDQADMHHFNAIEQYLGESEEKQLDLIRFYYDDSEDMFDNHTYAKGGRVLHMLRKLLGDKVFFDGLSLYLKQNALSSVEVHNLRLALEKASGLDLNWFFNQWFLSSGHPQLKISWDDTDPENRLLRLEQQQDLSQSPLYKIPFKVSIYKDGQRIEKSFVLDQAVQEFPLQNGAGTQLVLFDEFRELLSERIEYRGFENLEKQFLLSTSGLARVEALDSLTGKYSEQLDYFPTIERALEDSFHVVRELALHRMNRLDASEADKSNLENKILKLVEEDSDNAVRAAALEALAGIGGTKYQQLFYRLINAPSYQVSGAALTAYLDIEGNIASKEELFERLKEEENIRIIAPLADYLTREQKAEAANWMHEKLASLTGESLYYFLGYYGDFFASVEGVATGEAVSSLGEIASTHKLSYVRLAAYQSLFGFIDDPGVLELAKGIQSKEMDEMVREYEAYYLSPYLDEN